MRAAWPILLLLSACFVSEGPAIRAYSRAGALSREYLSAFEHGRIVVAEKKVEEARTILREIAVSHPEGAFDVSPEEQWRKQQEHVAMLIEASWRDLIEVASKNGDEKKALLRLFALIDRPDLLQRFNERRR